MEKRTAKKVEAWLTQNEWAIVKAHMARCHVDSVANYVRLAVLAGLPSQSMQRDELINELALAINRLSRSEVAGAAKEVAVWLPHAKRVAKDLQRSRAFQHMSEEGGV
ncbi:hypothetical protein [Roseicyclus marinus]|jgi:hypothetical protein|uniref:hypothetical protein n=1 Tax=Roseicyclus marinus TaxID=2161673 RepID=UPI00240FE9A0|nr:hypothetical protein [Roseicyclus marinus]MDG3039792.1 hypothetical protein [Roseicyclus marinus]